jgi:CDP-6-deoxy-D-xylo-4-hexulose-3-dehydrase
MSKKIWYAPNQKEAYGEAEIKAVINCLNDGWLAGFGPRTVEFEKVVASAFSKKYGLFVNSGSSAILLGLNALNLEPGSEVITPACTFSTTLAPIIQCGLKPVFCDVELGTYVPNVDQVCAKITDKTKLILLPNLIGSKPDWSEIRKRVGDIICFEDSADTVTSTPETDISITSFYSSHLITACGSGGMVMFNDERLLKRATMFRDWGRIGDNSEDVKTRFEFNIDGIPYDYKFLYGAVGYNMKSSEVNAAFGLVQMSRIEEIREKRRAVFNRYLENLKDIEDKIILPVNTFNSDWLAIPFMTPKRLELLTFLEENNIQTRVCFAGNVTRHPVYREYLEEFPNSDRIMAEGFLLGAHHGMTIEDVDYVCSKIKEFFKIIN